MILFARNATAQSSKWAPSAIRLGGDPGTFYYMIFSEERGFFEAEADIDINQFFLVANYGISNYRLDKPTFLYTNKGSYMRFGADFNFMNKDPNNNVGFFGFRYAISSFEDQLDFDTQQIIESDIGGWPNTRETKSNSNVRANWIELVTGMKIRVVKQLYMGFTVRYKLFMDFDGATQTVPYYIPGFGKNVKTSGFGFNYYISYRLPFRKKTVFLDENKDVMETKEEKKRRKRKNEKVQETGS